MFRIRQTIEKHTFIFKQCFTDFLEKFKFDNDINFERMSTS